MDRYQLPVTGVVKRPFEYPIESTSPVLALLSHRERNGSGNRQFLDRLSSHAAWNRRRMQDMILAVGPKTPAAMVLKPIRFSRRTDGGDMDSTSDSEDQDYEEEDEVQIEEDDRELQEEDTSSDRLSRQDPQDEAKDGESQTNRIEQETNVGFTEQPSSQVTSSSSYQPQASLKPPARRKPLKIRPTPRPAIQHGGCINTAAWLTGGWKISFQKESLGANPENYFTSVGASLTHECPTQLITAGDDRTVKFFDVSGAMGSTSPLPAGLTTHPAFLEPYPTQPHPQSTVKEWKYRHQTLGIDLPGSVLPLATLSTSHRGNIFHVTPVPGQPGLIATCAADGYLHLSHVEHAVGPPTSFHSRPRSNSTNGGSTSTTVVSPEFAEDRTASTAMGGLAALLGLIRSTMCFSHHFVTPHIGLLCSERGLHKFDIRLPPREQPRRSLLYNADDEQGTSSSSSPRMGGSASGVCKACAIWDPHRERLRDGFWDAAASDSTVWDRVVESTYAFAGGASGVIGLYDLRMDGGGSSSSGHRVIQTYLPRQLVENSEVTVSGLDVSRDGTELLVSYDNDQIYTFDIVPKGSRGLDEDCNAQTDIQAYSLKNGCEQVERKHVQDNSSYGGHLNRFTFLKGARYAGPRDEYICTGSDSGHAWIYDRDTGSVVSLLKADRSTCNGVIPHPSLPVFITYGIDSTAKLWRATVPVISPRDSDDLNILTEARKDRAQKTTRVYKKSTLVRQWKMVQRQVALMGDVEEEGCLPDTISYRMEEDDESDADMFFSRLSRHRVGPQEWDMGDYTIANNLKSLPELLQLNYDTCAREVSAGKDVLSIRSGIKSLARKVSLARLRHQADRLGLRWNRNVPWIMEFSDRAANSRTEIDARDPLRHPADLVPDYPSDWMPYDAEMTPDPKDYGYDRKLLKHRDFLCITCGTESPRKPWLRRRSTDGTASDRKTTSAEPSKATDKSEPIPTDSTGAEEVGTRNLNSSTQECPDRTTNNRSAPYSDERAFEILLETILVLKDGGNEALEAGDSVLAARRYDKAITYCSLAVLAFSAGNLHFLEPKHSVLLRHDGIQIEWTPLFKALLTTRLNLSLSMQKPEVSDWEAAMDQARLTLQELKPFAIRPGRVVCGKNGIDQEIPASVFEEAKELQAKAYFRLGTAQYSSKDYSGAAHSFEKSVQATKESKPGAKPEAIVLRRLAEAKQNKARRKERMRKRYKTSVQGDVSGGENDEGRNVD